MLLKKIHLAKLEVSTESDSFIGDSQISHTCDINSDDLAIVLRKDKWSCPSMYRYIICRYVSSKHLSK